MTGWGERKDRGTGSTGETEIAHEAMDKLGIPGGNLAERTLTLVTRHAAMAEQLERISLSYIEAANPGIDMDEVKRTRAGI